MSQPLATTSVKDVNESIIFPPGDIYSDEPPLESDLHREQIDLLIRLIKWWWRDRQDFYATGKANQQLQQTNQELEQERQRTAILAERLRVAGIDPEQIF
ncbi:MAG: hypothetical protein ICV85_00845 [Tolypothrix sp. T3-bin4]|nr:hypothetical protein [Tolypothrix sp. T3-bin4]